MPDGRNLRNNKMTMKIPWATSDAFEALAWTSISQMLDDTRVRQGSVRCAIAESLHGIGPMRCSCPLPVPRGRWLDVLGSSQEMAGKCSSASKSEDVHLLTVGRTLAAGWHHRGDSTKKSLPY